MMAVMRTRTITNAHPSASTAACTTTTTPEKNHHFALTGFTIITITTIDGKNHEACIPPITSYRGDAHRQLCSRFADAGVAATQIFDGGWWC
jgi:hypothetical protein